MLREDKIEKIGTFGACFIEHHQGEYTYLLNMMDSVRPCATAASKADIISVFTGCRVRLVYILATFFTSRPPLSWYVV